MFEKVVPCDNPQLYTSQALLEKNSNFYPASLSAFLLPRFLEEITKFFLFFAYVHGKHSYQLPNLREQDQRVFFYLHTILVK